MNMPTKQEYIDYINIHLYMFTVDMLESLVKSIHEIESRAQRDLLEELDPRKYNE